VPKIDFLPAVGINVYDIVKRDQLILSVDAINSLNERFAK
jgi:ribosomal protein L4